MKIAIITPVFTLAGVPLAQFRFAEALSKSGYHVELIIGHVKDSANLLKSDKVKITILNKKRVRNLFFFLVSFLFKKKCDILFSAEDHLNIMVLMCAVITKSKIKISCSSRVTPFDTYSDKILSKKWFLKILNFFLYKRANVLTCVSKEMVNQYKKIFPKINYQYAYNIIEKNLANNFIKNPIQNHKWFYNNNIKIISAGKLAEWKGFEYLIKAIRILCDQNQNIQLSILGDGPLKQKLIYMIDELKLNENIKLFGFVNNPYQYFEISDIFVLSSLVEGMPNVLIESMLCGCTPVATRCKTGPEEIITDGKNGYLCKVGDSVDLANSIKKAIDKPINIIELENSTKQFSSKNVIKRHFQLLGVDT